MNVWALIGAVASLSAIIAQTWFYCRILRKAGHSPWWTATLFIPILLGIVAAVGIPVAERIKTSGSSIPLGLIDLGISATLFAMMISFIWLIVSVWLFAFIRWPAIKDVRRNISWKDLAEDNGQESTQYFEIAASELTSGKLHPGSWGRALALSDSESVAKSKYVQLRVAALARENDEKTAASRKGKPALDGEGIGQEKKAWTVTDIAIITGALVIACYVLFCNRSRRWLNR